VEGTGAAQRIAPVDLRAQRAALDPELTEAIERVFARGVFILGPEVAAFEEEFAAYCGSRHCVTTASGTDALTLALSAAGAGAGTEVVTVAHTAVPTAFAIEAAGSTPAFVDVDPETLTIDADEVARAVGPATRAIVPVHLYGRCAELEPLVELADRHGLALIEDACQAHGALQRGRRAGSVGLAGCFSFYPTKNLGAYGDGGCVVTDDDELAERVRLLRNHGLTGGYVHAEPAVNSRLDELQAAILRVKLPKLDGWNEERRRLAGLYDEALRELPLDLPAPAGEGHVFHLYVVRTPRRDELLEHLRESGIGAAVHYPLPAHRQPAYAGRPQSECRLPATDQAAAEVLSLPLYPELGDSGVARVATSVRDFFEAER
jgi:dTDP-4-amino-4,6-dideoxygalactose transaminase